jgi:NAD(P)-dependent dehydrogenase (short-subunit alcohol dehydrogenase family)
MGRLNGNMAVVLGAAGRGDMGQVIAQRFRDEDAQVVVSVRAMTGGESLIQIGSATATIMLNDHAWSCV